MKRNASDVLRDGPAGPVEARAALAGAFSEGMDSEADEDVEAAWQAEVIRRVAELDSGAVKAIPWSEIQRRMA